MARAMAERDPSLFMPFQYANEANPAAHYCGTALEILEQVPDGQVDAFVAGLGTGGTLMGCRPASARGTTRTCRSSPPSRCRATR